MEVVAVMGSAILAWASCFVLVSMDGSASPLRPQRMWLRIRTALGALASLRVTALLAGVPAWSNLARSIRGRLEARGLVLTPEESVAALPLVVAIIGLAGGVVSRSLVGGLVVAGVAVIAVYLLESTRERRRASALAEEMPGIFRTLAIAIGSGQTLSQAIDYVGSHEVGPAAEEFARTSLRLRCGIPAEEALASMVEELDAPGVGLLVTALLISQRTGCPLRDLFQRSARLVERQGEFERMLSVKTAQVRLSVRIVCLLPVVMIATLSLISSDFQQGLSTPAGTGSVLLALGMDAVALLIIRRLLKGVL